MRRPVWTAIVSIVIAPAMLFMASCAKETMQSQPENTPPAAEAARGSALGAQPEARPPAAPSDPAAVFRTQNVHFDFASATLSQPARQILNAKAEYLLANPGVAFTVEGHCDERGTSAYNMALGERRAEIVKQYLSYQGIGAERMRTISYGEERPLDSGRNEASWAQNRRAQFTVE